MMTATKLKEAQVDLPSDREVRVVREFNAPAQLLWDAHTKPDLIRRWMLGPDGWSMPVCEIDLRVGGRYRWGWRNDADGKEFGFTGEFQELNEPARIVHSEYFVPGTLTGTSFPEGDPAIITNTMSEANGRTTLTVVMRFASKEARDGAVATGMTDGMEKSYQRLEKQVLEAA